MTGVDGASVRFRKLSGTAAPTVRVARNGSGAPQLPAQVQPVGGIYEFTPLGQLAAGIELRVPFERSALAAGQRPRLLVAAPGEPWTEVVGARVDGAAMVGRVPRLSHAVAAVGVGDRQSAPPATKLLRLMSPDAPPEPLTLAIDHGMTEPSVPAADADGFTWITQPTRLALKASYDLPECNGTPHLSVVRMRLAWVESESTQSSALKVLLSRPLGERTGSIDIADDLVASESGTMLYGMTVSCYDETLRNNAYVLSRQLDTAVQVAMPEGGFPVITQQPSDVNAVEGRAATFSVVASGIGLHYQWVRSDDGGETLNPVGTDSPSVTITATQADSGSLWRVMVINAQGLSVSATARLTVSQQVVAPVVTADPANQSVVEGETASFTVAGSGMPAPSVQWQSRPAALADPEAGWTAIAGARDWTYNTAATALEHHGMQYRAVLQNAGGSAASSPATLAVQQRITAPAITTGPASLSVEAERFAAFAVSASGTSPLSFQWFRNGEPIVGANASEVLVYAEPADAGGSYQITVQVSNPAGSVMSAAATMTITARPPTNPGTLVSAAEGGAIELAGDAALVLPAGALLSDTLISVATAPSSSLELPEGLLAQGDVIDIGPSGLSFAQPVTLNLPAADTLPADKVWALVELPASSSGAAVNKSAVGAQPRAKAAVNVRRSALRMLSAGQQTVAAAAAIGSVLCADAQSSRGGRQLVDLMRAARYVPAAVPESACSGSATTRVRPKLPSTTTLPCRDNEFASDSLGNEVLVSRHVHCGRNASELGWLQDERGNYGYFQLEWRVGSDGAARGLSKNYRAKFRLVRLMAADVNPINTPLQLRLRVALTCASQQFSGACANNVGQGSVTAGQGWSSEVLLPATFSWNGGADTWNEFIFNQINVFYAMPGQVGESTLQISGPPRIRCDKQMVGTGDGCVYPDAPAVLVMSVGDTRVREAAEHIREAQAWGSPGGLDFDAAGQSFARESNALHRTRYPAANESNRIASCRSSSSLFQTRPQVSSASCSAAAADCQCDEYPFAATYDGGWFSPDRTSVKRIFGRHNERGGSLLGGLLSN